MNEQIRIKNRNEYLEHFGNGSDEEEQKEAIKEGIQYEALKMALDIRKFEIDMYWKRATYFWTFIGAAFAGYFLLINSNAMTYKLWGYILTVSILGFLFSLSWYLVNRGSKFWQNNWERHVDYLEDEIMGPLYKTVRNPELKSFWNPFAEYPMSVSKINQLLSLIVSLIWLGLISECISIFWELKIYFAAIISFAFAFLTVTVFYYLCRSDLTPKRTRDTESSFIIRKID